jgi:hypothetical protein
VGFGKPDFYKTNTKTHNCIFITGIINAAKAKAGTFVSSMLASLVALQS